MMASRCNSGKEYIKVKEFLAGVPEVKSKLRSEGMRYEEEVEKLDYQTLCRFTEEYMEAVVNGDVDKYNDYVDRFSNVLMGSEKKMRR